MPEPMHVISLGAGVQSSVLLMMAERGEITPRPAAAIFADTRWEPPQVYEHLDWMESQTSIPIRRICESDLFEDVWAGVNLEGGIFTSIPVFAETPSGAALSKRECTSRYKIRPIRREVRRLLGKGVRDYIPPGSAVQWLGISKDEWHRQKDSDVKWLVNRHPLLELGMTRADCLAWWKERYPDRKLAKSACVGCPFHSDRNWLDLLRQCPDAMERTVALDAQLRSVDRPSNPKTKQYAEYLHRSLRPLSEVLSRLDAADRAQLPLLESDGFGNECEGHCGV